MLNLQKINKSYHQAGAELPVLRDIDLILQPGELVALVGASGSGKSTLLQIAGLLDVPSSGQVVINGQDVSSLNEMQRTQLRGKTVGFVYQFHHLLPDFSAAENIMLPQLLLGVKRDAAKARAAELLEKVGLKARADHRPGQLSGGEQQRVAIARALANKPQLLLADEPTGNLDEGTAAQIFALLLQLVRQEGLAALIATHNPQLAAQMDRSLYLHTGHLSQQSKPH